VCVATPTLRHGVSPGNAHWPATARHHVITLPGPGAAAAAGPGQAQPSALLQPIMPHSPLIPPHPFPECRDEQLIGPHPPPTPKPSSRQAPPARPRIRWCGRTDRLGRRFGTCLRPFVRSFSRQDKPTIPSPVRRRPGHERPIDDDETWQSKTTTTTMTTEMRASERSLIPPSHRSCQPPPGPPTPPLRSRTNCCAIRGQRE
jgi:hypothetical protein